MSMTVIDRKECTDCPIHIRGSVHALGATVPRGFLQVVGDAAPTKFGEGASGRRELAEWLVNERNPLTPRVFANRVWQGLFGEGIVRTPDNFGTTGEPPSHPELLDAISTRFVESGWSLKFLTRELVLAQVYQQSSESREDARGRLLDPENRLLWRMNRKRLEAEALRDAALVVAGNLDRTLLGSSIPPATNVDYNFKHSGTRRSLYLPVFRNALPDIFEAFDFADPSLVVGRRNVSTVAPQALFLMNHPFMREQARLAAERIVGETISAQPPIDRAFLVALGRGPNAAERQIAQEWLSRSRGTQSSNAEELERWTELFHTLLSSLDFRYRD
jgi:hypothetical protein